MKRALLLAIFTFCGIIAFSQNRLAKTKTSKPKKELNALKVFPNPATNYIGIDGNIDGASKLLVYSLVGKELKNYKVSEGANYFVGDLPKGLYLIQITDKRGKAITTQRVSKR